MRELDRQDQAFSSFLDLARWLAAFLVVANHLRNPIWVGFPDVEQQTLFVKGLYLISGLGYEAVLVFFVLSGYLVGGIGFMRIKTRTFSLPSYAIDRLTRLYVVLLPAVLIGFALDVLGRIYFPEAGLYNHQNLNMRVKFPDHVIADHTTAELLASNLLMLQSFFTKTVGSNFPLWSLSYEFWFYVVFGLVAATTGAGHVRLALYTLLAAGVSYWLGPKFVAYLAIWTIGIGVALYPGQPIKSPVAASVLFGACLLGSRLEVFEPQYLRDCLVAVSFGLLMLSMRGRDFTWLHRSRSLNQKLAGFSYTLYLTHFPVMLFILSVWASVFGVTDFINGYQPDGKSGLLYLCVFAATILASFAFARHTEYYTAGIRRFLKRRLGIDGAIPGRAALKEN